MFGGHRHYSEAAFGFTHFYLSNVIIDISARKQGAVLYLLGIIYISTNHLNVSKIK